MTIGVSSPTFTSLVQEFFYQRLVVDSNASRQTIISYRDSFRLLLRYAERVLRRSPTALTLADLDAPFISAFLDHLEKERRNSVRTRNVRFAAIRSFLHYAALRDPASLPSIHRVLAIPMKRFDRPILGYLSREHMEAILLAPDSSRWSGHRDQVMFATFYNTGARVSEVIALRVSDANLERHPSLLIQGKGRKQRVVPLWKSTIAKLKEWLQRVDQRADAPLFPNRNGKPLSRSGIEKRVRQAVRAASIQCPTLKGRNVTPHTFRHTTAMHLLQSGVDITVIALWLGHEGTNTTHAYIEADLTMKEQALKRIQDPGRKQILFRPRDQLLAFLESL
jgi:site-specific recombinase XerD